MSRTPAHSSGPKTPEGKAASSQNATRHGLAGAFTVLPHESQENYDELAAAIQSEYRPEGDTETFLVQQMTQSRWKMLRIERLEELAFEQILTEPGADADPDARILATIVTSGNPLDKLQRYAATAERAWYKAKRELEAARLRSQKSGSKAIGNDINNAVNAPVPGEPKPPVQNEPNPPSAKFVPGACDPTGTQERGPAQNPVNLREALESAGRSKSALPL